MGRPGRVRRSPDQHPQPRHTRPRHPRPRRWPHLLLDAELRRTCTARRRPGETVVSSGWAFVQADVDLKGGTGPLAGPILGGSDVGSSSTDLDPVFGLGLMRFLPDEQLAVRSSSSTDSIRDRRLAPTSTSTTSGRTTSSWTPATSGSRSTTIAACGPSSASSSDPSRRSAPTAPRAGDPGYPRRPGDQPRGRLVLPRRGTGASYLIREDLTFDFGAFYEYALDPTTDTVTLDPFPNNPPLDQPSTFDGALGSGLYLTAGLSWVFDPDGAGRASGRPARPRRPGAPGAGSRRRWRLRAADGDRRDASPFGHRGGSWRLPTGSRRRAPGGTARRRPARGTTPRAPALRPAQPPRRPAPCRGTPGAGSS